jgi:hypothetical protein
MTKAIFIETVLLRIGGGRLPDDASVKRKDIKAYLPSAINYVVTEGMYTNIKAEGDRDFSGLFYAFFNDLPILLDVTRKNRPYIILPKKPIALPKNAGVRFVSDNCEHNYTPINDGFYSNIDYYTKLFPSERFYYLQGDKLLLWNVGPLEKKMKLSLIVDVDDIEDSENLPIQAGLEAKAIDMCVAFFTGQRQTPGDLKADKKDLNVS